MSNPFKDSHYISQINQVLDHLYIGGYACLQDSKLKDLGITLIVDATNIPRKPSKYFEYVKVAVDDNERSHLTEYFDVVADRVKAVKENKGRALVHCAAGISRSAALCLAYLVKHENMTLKEAYLFLRTKRPIISPNNGFWKQLLVFEHRVRGENSVHMITPRYRELPDVYFNEFLATRRDGEQE